MKGWDGGAEVPTDVSRTYTSDYRQESDTRQERFYGDLSEVRGEQQRCITPRAAQSDRGNGCRSPIQYDAKDLIESNVDFAADAELHTGRAIPAEVHTGRIIPSAKQCGPSYVKNVIDGSLPLPLTINATPVMSDMERVIYQRDHDPLREREEQLQVYSQNLAVEVERYGRTDHITWTDIYSGRPVPEGSPGRSPRRGFSGEGVAIALGTAASPPPMRSPRSPVRRVYAVAALENHVGELVFQSESRTAQPTRPTQGSPRPHTQHTAKRLYPQSLSPRGQIQEEQEGAGKNCSRKLFPAVKGSSCCGDLIWPLSSRERRELNLRLKPTFALRVGEPW